VVWLHGGAFILGDLDSSDAVCARISAAAGALVVNVDYRLAPEHPCPAGLHDAYAALEWVARESTVDPTRSASAGSSAGRCRASEGSDGCNAVPGPCNGYDQVGPAPATPRRTTDYYVRALAKRLL